MCCVELQWSVFARVLSTRIAQKRDVQCKAKWKFFANQHFLHLFIEIMGAGNALKLHQLICQDLLSLKCKGQTHLEKAIELHFQREFDLLFSTLGAFVARHHQQKALKAGESP